MIYKKLENIVEAGREKHLLQPYIVNSLKEYLQIYVLYFIYTSTEYQKRFIFTGGTCLHHFFGLERLSVDLDFDIIGKIDPTELEKGLKSFFQKKYKYEGLTSSIKQGGEQLLLKFPVLQRLGLSTGNETDLLYVKIDLTKIPSDNYSTDMTSKNKYGLNFVSKHYDLPSLMSGKLHAILKRKYLRGREDQKSIKGRDYFDLLWFVKKGVRPNLKRLSDMLGEKVELKDVGVRIDEKVEVFLKKHKSAFESDMVSLIEDSASIDIYVNNYSNEYLRYRAQSFSQIVNLDVRCSQCNKVFSAGISLQRDSFENMADISNVHKCPFCGHKNKIVKKDYILEDL